ncbi:MAG TPA: methyltransferase domain-containing protein [Rhizobiales bacterium]|nr:methyltransferase domain-containing protein [Hyphomicrobiales bacterium]
MTDHRALFDTALVRSRREKCRQSADFPDFLDCHVARDIAGRLAMIDRKFNRCLVAGAASGTFAEILRQTGKLTTLIAPPVAADPGHGDLAVRFDEEFLPFAEKSLDCVIAAPGLELVNDLPGALIQIRRALRPDGLFIAAMLAGDSLHELRQAWLMAETELKGGASLRVIPFADVRQSGNLLQRAGFALGVSDIETVKVRYQDGLALMRELKAMGLANPLARRSRTPVTRTLLAKACAIYDGMFKEPDGKVAATFQINYLTGWAPHESQQKPLKPGSAKMRLADALKPV